MEDEDEMNPLAAQAKELQHLTESVHKRTLSRWFADLARAERISNGMAERIRLSMEPRR
jgi:hypothetical protein